MSLVFSGELGLERAAYLCCEDIPLTGIQVLSEQPICAVRNSPWAFLHSSQNILGPPMDLRCCRGAYFPLFANIYSGIVCWISLVGVEFVWKAWIFHEK